MSERMWRLLIAGLLVASAACGDDSNDEPDSGAKLACGDFRATAQDQTDGLLTAGELRSEIQGVQDNARLSEEPGVADAGRDLLAAVTEAGQDVHDNPALADAVTAFGTTCENLGL